MRELKIPMDIILEKNKVVLLAFEECFNNSLALQATMLYLTLKKHNINYPREDIGKLFGISYPTMFKIIKKLKERGIE